MQVFLWNPPTRCTVRADRKAADVDAVWLSLTVYWTRPLTPSEQEVWPSRDFCSEKDETDDEADGIAMKIYLIQLLLLYFMLFVGINVVCVHICGIDNNRSSTLMRGVSVIMGIDAD